MAVLSEFGAADWVDYVDYWREADAEWLQARLVLRVLNNDTRDDLEQLPGGVVYNDSKDALELRSKAGGYKTLTPLPGTLTTAEVAGPPQKTTIGHIGAGGGQGLVFSAAEIEVTSDFNVKGVLTVNSGGVSIKTGAKTARLSTDATNLISDTPVSAPGVVITAPGALSASGRTGVLGSLTVEGTLTSGAVNAGSAQIGGVNGVIVASNKVTAPSGFDSVGGSFYGDANSAIMRTVNRTGPYVQAATTGIVTSGGYFDFYNQVRLIGAAAFIQHYNTGKNIAPSFYAAPTPDVNAYPEGTIWIS